MKIFNYNLVSRRGNVLLLALLLLAGGMVGTLSLTTIVVSQLHQSRVIDASTIAHYEAESALEEGLYSTRQLNSIASVVAPSSSNCLASDLGCAPVTFNQDFLKSSSIQLPLLSADQTFELDVTPPADTLRSYTGLSFTWRRGSGGVPSLVITYINKDNNGAPVITRQPSIGAPYQCGALNDGDLCGDLVSINLDISSTVPLTTQKVRFRAVGADIKDLEISPICTTSNCGFDNYVKLKTTGKKSGTNYVLQTSIPTSVPAYGIADYVLFSEQDVVK